MPRPPQQQQQPLTPPASVQPRAQNGAAALEHGGLEICFELPPSALENSTRSPSFAASDSEYQPPAPKVARTPRKGRGAKRCGTARDNEDEKENEGVRRPAPRLTAKQQIILPPPPGRARRIIEMKPKPSPPSTSTTTSGTTSSGTAHPPSKPLPKKSTTSSRKISRKTAHSLIERRRRGKMNDEFEALKRMVPACRDGNGGGREMHKLEVLRACGDYIGYLRGCVGRLQGGEEGGLGVEMEVEREGGRQGVEGETGGEEEEDTDVEMEMEPSPPEEEAQPPGRSTASPPIDPQLMSLPLNTPPTPKLSPAILPKPAYHRNSTPSISSLSSSHHDQRHNPSVSSVSSTHSHSHAQSYFPTTSQTTSHTAPPPPQHPTLFPSTFAFPSPFTFPTPALGPSTSAHTSAFTSPLLAAQADQDATVALLMLNGDWPSRGHMGSRDEADRFGSRRRGLSVRDLLSS